MPPQMEPNVRRVHDVLVRSWDPLGVRLHPRAEDEYECFARTLCDLLLKRHSEDAVFAYLRWAAERMGIAGPQEVLRPVAAELMRVRFRKGEQRGQQRGQVTYLRTPRQAA